MANHTACLPARQPVALAEKVAFLQSHPGARGRRGEGRGEEPVIETHFAWIFLHGRHAYKLHKPMHWGSMDYRTLAARRRGCVQELRLNRRLAPEVYRDVIALVRRRDGSLQLGGRGVVQDYLVRMRRLSAGQMLDRVLQRQAVNPHQLDRVAGTLLRFFDAAPRRPLTAAGYLGRLRAEVLAGRRALLRCERWLGRERVQALCAGQLRLLCAERSRLGLRAAHLIDGHGDLRPEHIHLGRRVSVIDCVEFDAELRRQDPMREVAQLAVQIEYLQHPQFARALLSRCRPAGGGCPPSVVSCYLSLAALTLARLSVGHLGEPGYPDARPWVAKARLFLDLAQRHLANARRDRRRASAHPIRASGASAAAGR